MISEPEKLSRVEVIGCEWSDPETGSQKIPILAADIHFKRYVVELIPA